MCKTTTLQTATFLSKYDHRHYELEEYPLCWKKDIAPPHTDIMTPTRRILCPTPDALLYKAYFINRRHFIWHSLRKNIMYDSNMQTLTVQRTPVLFSRNSTSIVNPITAATCGDLQRFESNLLELRGAAEN